MHEHQCNAIVWRSFSSSSAHLLASDILCLVALRCVEPSTLAYLPDRNALRDALAKSDRILRPVLQYVRDFEMTSLHGLTVFFQLFAENTQSVQDKFREFARSCCSLWDSFLFDEIMRVSSNFQLFCESTEKYLSSDEQRIAMSVKEARKGRDAEAGQVSQTDRMIQVDPDLERLIESYILRPIGEYSTATPTKLFHHESIIRVLLHGAHRKLSRGSIRGATENMRSLFRFLSYKNYGVWWVVAQYPLAQIAYAMGNVLQCMRVLVELDAQSAPAFLLTHAYTQLAMVSFYHDILMDWMGSGISHATPEAYGEIVPFEFLHTVFGQKLHRSICSLSMTPEEPNTMDTTADQSQAYLAHAHVHAFFSQRLLHQSIALHEVVFSARYQHDEKILLPAVNHIFLHQMILSSSAPLSTEGKLYLWCFLLRSAVEDRQCGLERLRQCCDTNVIRTIFPLDASSEPAECIRVSDRLYRATLMYCTAVLLMDVGCCDGAMICLVNALRGLHHTVIFHAEEVLFQINARSLLSALAIEKNQHSYAKDILEKACSMGVNFYLRSKYLFALRTQREIMEQVNSASQIEPDVARMLICSGGLLGAQRFAWFINTDGRKATWEKDVEQTRYEAFLSQWTPDKIFQNAEESTWELFCGCLDVFSNSS